MEERNENIEVMENENEEIFEEDFREVVEDEYVSSKVALKSLYHNSKKRVGKIVKSKPVKIIKGFVVGGLTLAGGALVLSLVSNKRKSTAEDELNKIGEDYGNELLENWSNEDVTVDNNIIETEE